MNTQQLRQKILDLAIRGQLVPQDENDEPAQVLLEKIRAEKEKNLPKKGKPSSTSPYQNEEESPFQIPENWVWCKLGEIFNIIMGQSPQGENVSEDGKKEFHQGKIYFTSKYIDFSNVYTNQITKIAPVNSVLLCVRAPVGEVNITNRELCIGRGLCSIVPIEGMNVLFVYYWMKTLKNSLEQKATGSTFASVSMDIIKNEFFPLPPLPEQHRIISKIEEIFALIDVIEQNQSDLKTTIEKTKAKVLDMAIRGELLNDENHHLETLDNEHYTDEEFPFEIPKHWKWKKLGEVCEILDNLRKPINADERNKRIENKKEKELYPYYGATGQVGFIDDFIFDGNFILLGEDGAPFLDNYAKKAYKVSGKVWVNNHAHILKPTIEIDYLCHFLNRVDYSSYVSGTTRLKLTQKEMKNIKIPLPPLEEQKRIVQKIEKIFSELDKIETFIN